MTDPPNSPVQAAARIAESAIDGLKGSPLILAVLLLNAIGIGAALWFLTRLAAAQSARLDVILKACLPKLGG
jgi:type IV secretory pathway TrbD component